MKIGLENILNTYSTVASGERRNSVRGAAGNGQLNLDKAEFTSTARQIEEKIFSENSARVLWGEVLGTKDNSARISELRDAVEKGAYEPDSREIAAKILLLGGGK